MLGVWNNFLISPIQTLPSPKPSTALYKLPV
jgi:hypothetical protein